eukprot:gene7450-9156_t
MKTNRTIAIQSITKLDVVISDPNSFSILLLKKDEDTRKNILPFIQSLYYYTPLNEYPDLNESWLFSNLQILYYTLHSEDSVESLDSFLKVNPSITKLDLILKKQLFISSILEKHSNIQTLAIKAEGKLLGQSIQPVINPSNSSVKILKCSGNIEYKGLAEIVMYNTCIETLEVEGELTYDIKLLFDALVKNSTIKHLKANIGSRNSIITLDLEPIYESISKVFSSNKTLVEFIWRGNIQLGNNALVGLSNNTTLKDVQFRNWFEFGDTVQFFKLNSVESEPFNNFITNNLNLEKLHCLLSKEGNILKAISSHLYLTDLTIAGNEIIGNLGSILVGCQSLKKLFINSGITPRKPLEKCQILDLEESLMRNSSIQELRLKSNLIETNWVETIIKVNHPSLKTVSIHSDSELRTIGIEDYFATNTTLETFELVGQVYKFYEFLESVLSRNHTLQHLRFITNQLPSTDRYTTDIIKLLKCCTTLKTLNINSLYSSGFRKISPRNVEFSKIKHIKINLE